MNKGLNNMTNYRITPPHTDGKHILPEVVIIRLVLIVLLVFYHSFAIYGGSWQSIEGFPSNQIYCWLDRLSYSFMLESFVFISGYILGCQVKVRGNKAITFSKLFVNKLKRLMLPCMVFSFLYITLFGDFTQSVPQTIYSLINGYAHMWFLPMLFWCFMFIIVIERLKIKPGSKILILIFASLLSVNGLPLQLSHSMYYMIFFYLGYAINKYNVEVSKYCTLRNVIFSILIFCFLFVVLTLIKENRDLIFLSKNIIVQSLKFVVGKICMLVYSTAGIIMLFLTSRFIMMRIGDTIPQVLIEISNLCFGVYLFQQFFLHAFYYNSCMPYVIGPIFAPWIAFVSTLLLSLLLTWVVRLSKIGRTLL